MSGMISSNSMAIPFESVLITLPLALIGALEAGKLEPPVLILDEAEDSNVLRLLRKSWPCDFPEPSPPTAIFQDII